MLNVRALPGALADSCASPLTETYMDVGNPEVTVQILTKRVTGKGDEYEVSGYSLN
jgi:hypothetical protein